LSSAFQRTYWAEHQDNFEELRQPLAPFFDEFWISSRHRQFIHKAVRISKSLLRRHLFPICTVANRRWQEYAEFTWMFQPHPGGASSSGLKGRRRWHCSQARPVPAYQEHQFPSDQAPAIRPAASAWLLSNGHRQDPLRRRRPAKRKGVRVQVSGIKRTKFKSFRVNRQSSRVSLPSHRKTPEQYQRITPRAGEKYASITPCSIINPLESNLVFCHVPTLQSVFKLLKLILMAAKHGPYKVSGLKPDRSLPSGHSCRLQTGVFGK